MTSVHGMTAGDRVGHPTKRDWGNGQVLDIDLDSSRAEVFFVEAGRKVISLRHVSLTILDPRPNHPLLDRIDAEAAGGLGYRSISQSIKDFLNGYPGGFYGDRYFREERGYKVKAHGNWPRRFRDAPNWSLSRREGRSRTFVAARCRWRTRPSGNAAHSAPRRTRRGAKGSPLAAAGGLGRSPKW